MILPALLAVHPLTTQVAGDNTRVKAFVVAARIGLEPGIVLPPYPDEGEAPKVNDSIVGPEARRAGVRAYNYSQSVVCLNAAGRVVFFSDHSRIGARVNPDGTLAAPRVSLTQAITLARRFYAASGWGESVVRPIPDDHGAMHDAYDGRGDNDMSVEVHLMSSAGGALYDEARWDSLVTVNRETGQLDGFSSPEDELPALPPSIEPMGSPDAALRMALRAGAQLRGEPLWAAPNASFRLRVWLPRLEPNVPTAVAARSYGPTVRAALATGRGLLVYRGPLLGSSRASGVDAVIDARTGEALALDRFPGGSGGGAGAGGDRVRAESPAVPVVSRPWRVATNKAGWDAWTPPATTTLAPAPAKSSEGTSVLLTDGKAAFPATYNAKVNLLAIGGKTYRPGPALATLLKKRVKG